MHDKHIWQTIEGCLKNNEAVILIIVLKKEGSAPVKPGFKMAVASSGELSGTVGGGVVEFDLVERAKKMLIENEESTLFQRFEHRENAYKDQSGMICSGSHSVALIPINSNKMDIVREITHCYRNNILKCFRVSLNSFELEELCLEDEDHSFTETENGLWQYRENIGQIETLYIIGGGHVGLALSRVMKSLGFHITVIDNRQNLDTMKNNRFADELKIIDYGLIRNHVIRNAYSYVVIMTFRHQDDQLVLKNLVGGNYKYIGMMAAKAKRNKIYQRLLEEGVTKESLDKVHSPIGVPIFSETAEEIAVSIAAEIIKEKNT